MRIIKRLLSASLCLLAFFFVFLLCASVWAINHFGNLSFESILFTLSSPLGSTESNILKSFLLESLIPAAILLGAIIFAYLSLKRYFSQYDLILSLSVLSRKKTLRISGKKLLFPLKTFCFLFFLSLPIISAYLVGLFDYFLKSSDTSSFIADNYVDPAQVDLVFPEKKRNLIYIYAESFESSYFSKELGGIEEENLLEGITSLTQKNLNFSNTRMNGGAQVVYGTNFTTGGMTAQMLGLPSKTNLKFFTSTVLEKRYLPSATGLGDILLENGYSQYFLIGSDKHFGNRDLLLKDHGNYRIYDYCSAIEEGRVPSDYYVWWGIEDGKLFETAKEQLSDISHNNAPFNYTILTTNTHHFDGYQEEDCNASYDDPYANAIYCSAFQIADFISWAQQQDFYQNTTIVLVGDHQSMNNNHFSPEISPDERFVYNLFINAPISAANSKNRTFLTLDFFPTTLASIGVKIEGDRLGLGTNLFSDKETLAEEYGVHYIDIELSKQSDFYSDRFFKSD